MAAYIIRRLLLMIPTLLGILMVNFFIVQLAPGGPVEAAIMELQGINTNIGDRLTRNTGDAEGGGSNSAATRANSADSNYRGAEGLDPRIIEQLEIKYGFDKPVWQRFLIMLRDYATFNFGNSFTYGKPVFEVVADKLPVSISLGFWGFLFTYSICIPLGIAKARREGTKFDAYSTNAVIAVDAIPGFVVAIMLLVVFSAGIVFQIFPLQGLTSQNFDELSLLGKIGDYFWHMALPIITILIGGYASLTLLVKNSFLDQLRLPYVTTARAKGLTERKVMYGHVFRNAMLLVISGFPAAFVGIFFAGSVLIERIFGLDGLGLLGLDAIGKRDYPIIFATTYVFGLVGLMLHLLTDITYTLIDPRIDFEARG